MNFNILINYYKLIISLSILFLVSLTFFLFHDFIIARHADFALAKAMTSDGPKQSQRLLEMLNRNSTEPMGFYNYGNVHHFISFYFAKFLLLIGLTKTYTLAAFSLVFIQWISVILIFYLSYKILRFFNISEISSLFISIFSFTISPIMFYYSRAIHPDIVQLPFLLLIIYLLLKPNIYRIFGSSVLAGLAAGTKYIGILYAIPIITSFIFILDFSKFNNFFYNFRYHTLFLLYASGALLLFIFGFLIFNWTIPIYFETFLSDLIYESQHVSRGDGYAASENFFLWLPIFKGEYFYLWLMPIIMPLIYFMLKGKSINNSNLTYSTFPIMIGLFLLSVLIIIHLFFAVNMRVPRYTFHYYPIIIFSLAYFSYYLKIRFGNYIVTIFAIIIFSISLNPLRNSFNELLIDINYSKNGEKVLIGEALATSCNTDTSFIVPMYSYMPEIFNNRLSGYVFTDSEIKNSEVLVLNGSIPGRFIWQSPQEQLDRLKPYKGDHLDQADDQYLNFLQVFQEMSHKIVYFSGDTLIAFSDGADCNIKTFKEHVNQKNQSLLKYLR